jgi:hypothetical protein
MNPIVPYFWYKPPYHFLNLSTYDFLKGYEALNLILSNYIEMTH